LLRALWLKYLAKYEPILEPGDPTTAWAGKQPPVTAASLQQQQAAPTDFLAEMRDYSAGLNLDDEDEESEEEDDGKYDFLGGDGDGAGAGAGKEQTTADESLDDRHDALLARHNTVRTALRRARGQERAKLEQEAKQLMVELQQVSQQLENRNGGGGIDFGEEEDEESEDEGGRVGDDFIKPDNEGLSESGERGGGRGGRVGGAG
jgi:hypothetical protein